MSRLRWNTYDERGGAWRRARARGVAAALALSLTSLSGVSALATASRADVAPAPSADLDLLAQRQTAEEHALGEAFAARKAAVEKAGAERLAALQRGLDVDLVALAGAADEASRQRAQERQTSLGQLASQHLADERALRARSASERVSLDAFFSDVLAGLGPEGRAPTRTALDTAAKKLEAKRSSELSVLAAAHTAEYDALEARVRAAVAALDAEAHRLDDAHRAAEAAQAAALAAAKDALAADLTAITRTIDADTVRIKARHAQELLDLERLHRAQTAAASSASRAVRSALDDEQHLEEGQLTAMQANELAAQAHAKKAAELDEETARRAAEAQRAADEDAVDAAHAADRAAVAQRRSATSQAGSVALHALDDEHDLRYAAVKATYDAVVSGISKAHAGVRTAWQDRLSTHATEEVEAVQALGERTEVKRKQTDDGFADRGQAAERRLGHDEDGRQRRHRKDVTQAKWQAKKELGQAQRDHDRQLRLVASEYFTLKVRAVAFLQDPSSFTSVGAAFDPATDPGSLHSVAERIGATELPAHVTGKGVDVALIDTGVVDVPGLAEAEVEIGPDFSFEDVVPELRGKDTMGHGTHLGGIIAARDSPWNAGDTERRPDRTLGVAPGAGLVSVKAGAADGSVDVTQIIAAINWIIRNKATEGRNIRVINLSFGTDGVQDYRLDPLAHAVERAWQAGIVVVVAGGNDGWSAGRLTNPAQDPYVIAVGSSQTVDGQEDVPSSFSEGSAEARTVDLSAPGRSIASLRNEGSSSDEHNEAGRVGQALVRGSGTSQSAAVVSGAVALLLQARPELTPDQVKHVLMATADDPDDGDRGLAGAGYLRVDKAVKANVPWVVQNWERSTGAGTLDGARGSVRVVKDGIVLEGEYDVFGRSWSGSRWSDDSWSGSRWSGSRWSGGEWSGSRWSGSRWSSDQWSGTSWTGSRWSSDIWSGSRWSGSRWSSDGFTGSRWSGSRWSSGGWFGMGWDDGPSSTVTTGAEPVSAAAEQIATATPVP